MLLFFSCQGSRHLGWFKCGFGGEFSENSTRISWNPPMEGFEPIWKGVKKVLKMTPTGLRPSVFCSGSLAVYWISEGKWQLWESWWRHESKDSVDEGYGGDNGGDASSASCYGYRAMVIAGVFCLIPDLCLDILRSHHHIILHILHSITLHYIYYIVLYYIIFYYIPSRSTTT